MSDGCLGLWSYFTDIDALLPRVTKVCVDCTSTVFKPRTSSTATTSFARFRDDAAFGTYGAGDRPSDAWCLHVGIGQ